jgi:hypothetical protein
MIHVMPSQLFRQFLLVAIIFCSACSTPYVSNFSQVRRGMSEAEVIELLGPPRTRFIAADEVISQDKSVVTMGRTEAELGYTERWVYGERGLGLTSGLEQGFKYRAGSAYHIYFDQSGHVINYQMPEFKRLNQSIVTDKPY